MLQATILGSLSGCDCVMMQHLPTASKLSTNSSTFSNLPLWSIANNSRWRMWNPSFTMDMSASRFGYAASCFTSRRVEWNSEESSIVEDK
ncbi:hypothetical protein I7I53_09475 [Histoplasma capsulatum var. duboisii H88]|uniref:Uncharacterized protein n=1 Tax=Ajellomyces capsulatus (strain H88) TaxID=544711 RepID=A0A8A1LBM3_AJEC8|nr:hypothetical protein I7I53_09475 [Histoplasma capsulatum var. duboisii H88]